MKLNWRSNGINDFIAESMDKVNAVDEVVRTMKNNLQVRRQEKGSELHCWSQRWEEQGKNRRHDLSRSACIVSSALPPLNPSLSRVDGGQHHEGVGQAAHGPQAQARGEGRVRPATKDSTRREVRGRLDQKHNNTKWNMQEK